MKEAGIEADVFLIADAGFSSYATTIETMADTIENRPEVVECFVEGSAKGWYNFLYGDNTAARELIKADNPDIMLAWGIVDSGDALEKGILAINPDIVADFYAKMVAAGVVSDGLDISKTYTTSFVNQGVGMDLKPGN